jgi:hypothetical protein
MCATVAPHDPAQWMNRLMIEPGGEVNPLSYLYAQSSTNDSSHWESLRLIACFLGVSASDRLLSGHGRLFHVEDVGDQAIHA